MTPAATKTKEPEVVDSDPGELRVIPLESIIPAEDNLRHADPTDPEILAMAISMKEVGVLEPLLVEPHPFEDRSFRLKAGERRFVAAGVAGLAGVPCLIKTVDEKTRTSIFVVENVHREPLGPIELATGLKQMADEGLSQREIEFRSGVSQGHVSKLLSLLKLPAHVKAAVNAGTMSQEDALALAKLPATVIKDLCPKGTIPSDFVIRHAAFKAETDRKIARAVEAAKKAGHTIVDEAPDEWFQEAFTPAGTDDVEPASAAVALNGKWGTLGHVDPVEHASEPCHVVFIRHDGTATPGCNDPDAHPAPEKTDDDEDDEAPIAAQHPSQPRPRDPADVAATEAVESLLPTIKRAIASTPPAEQVLSFVAVALFRDEDPWRTALAAAKLLELTGTTDDALEDLCVLAEEDAGTALGAFAMQSYIAALHQVVADTVNTGTPLDVMETADDTKANVADARRLLDFLRLVVPDDATGTLEDIVADFAHGAGEGSINEFTGHCFYDGCRFVAIDSPNGVRDLMKEHYAEVHGEEIDAIATSAPGVATTVTISLGGKSGAPKYLRDCTACGRLSGFNTNKGDAERRSQGHLDTDHGGAGEVVTAA